MGLSSVLQEVCKVIMISVSVGLVRCVWAHACSALLTSKQLCACLTKLFHGQAWKNLVTIKCWMWLRGKIAKSTEHGLGIQSQVSTVLFHRLGSQNAYFFQHDMAWVLVKSSFMFFSAALSTVLPTHLCFSALSFSTFTWLSLISLMTIVYQLFNKLLAWQCSELLICKSWFV